MLIHIINTEYLTLSVHPQKNRIYCTLKGVFHENLDPDQLMEELQELKYYVSQEFTTLLEVRQESGQTPKQHLFVQDFQEFIVEGGSSKIAEILPDEPIIQKQSEWLATISGTVEKRPVFTNREDAETWLDASEDREDSRIATTQS